MQPSTDINQWRSSHKSQTFLIVHQHQSDQMTTLKHYFFAFESSQLFARCQNFWILFKLNASTKILSSQTVDVFSKVLPAYVTFKGKCTYIRSRHTRKGPTFFGRQNRGFRDPQKSLRNGARLRFNFSPFANIFRTGRIN